MKFEIFGLRFTFEKLKKKKISKKENKAKTGFEEYSNKELANLPGVTKDQRVQIVVTDRLIQELKRFNKNSTAYSKVIIALTAIIIFITLIGQTSFWLAKLILCIILLISLIPLGVVFKGLSKLSD